MQLQIIARQVVAALGGLCAHHGVTVDTHSTASFIAAGLFFLVSLGWSLFAKAEADDAKKEIFKKLSGALASQLVAALAGWLQADAGTVADPEALILFLGNATLSHVRGHVPPPTRGQWLWLLLPSLLCLCLSSCRALTSTPADVPACLLLLEPTPRVAFKLATGHTP
ncbi:MAG: hypothetical protein ACO1TE_29205 [Prosthecobacter sp.]